MIESNRDFQHFLEWLKKRYPVVDPDAAQATYDRYYTCNCESCSQRKRLGLPPVRLRPECAAPSHQIGEGPDGTKWILEAVG